MISRSEFLKILHEAIEAAVKKKTPPIGEQELFEDFGLDSLDRMNVLLELESRIDFELGELDLSVLRTPDLLYAELEKMRV